jgi:myo-inositol-1(or 4)-monophosphatase
LVTRAEIDLNDAFQKEIASHYPSHQIYGQTALDDSYSHGDRRFLWVFDPLDGVDNFQSGIPIWGMSLALYENHWPVMGLFYMPATLDLFHAQAGGQAFWNDRAIMIADRGGLSQESLLLTYSRFNLNYRSDFPGKTRSFGSTGAHACYVAMGRAEAAITASETFKDLAAVRVIVEAAGGRLYRIDGSDFYLGDYADGRRIEDHIIIAGKGGVASLQSCLRGI